MNPKEFVIQFERENDINDNTNMFNQRSKKIKTEIHLRTFRESNVSSDQSIGEK